MSFEFPDPRQSTSEGLVAVGGRLSPDMLLAAYRKGIFPWPQDDMPMLWFSPDPRGVIDFSEVHIPRSLEKFRRKVSDSWTFTVNKSFRAVMDECGKQKRPGQAGTWIIPSMPPAYQRLHAQGYALSVECWENDELIGGIYGVDLGYYFSGESMFFKRTNASKLSLLYLMDHLKTRGLTWMDVQMVTPVIESLGGKYISREQFLHRISEGLEAIRD